MLYSKQEVTVLVDGNGVGGSGLGGRSWQEAWMYDVDRVKRLAIVPCPATELPDIDQHG